MIQRFNALRWRLVLAFILVSVPPMLGAAFGVSTLISNTFESNVEDWLTETAHYFSGQIDEVQNDADHIAQLLANRLKGENLVTATPESLKGTPALPVVVVHGQDHRVSVRVATA